MVMITYREIGEPFSEVLTDNISLKTAIEKFHDSDDGYYPVITEDNQIVGILSVKSLFKALNSAEFSKINSIKELIDTNFRVVHGNDVVEFNDYYRYTIIQEDNVLSKVSCSKLIAAMCKQLNEQFVLNQELQYIMENSYDLITVIDGDGIPLKASSNLEKMFGIKMEEFIGTDVRELEKNGVLSKSVSNLVLQTNKKQTIIQDTKAGKRLLVTGIPIYDKDNKPHRVINFSRDITELSRLKIQLEETEELLNKYHKELDELRKAKSEEMLIAREAKMVKIVELATRVARVDSTILITGESGVGKEVVARFIHKLSPRMDKPFIKINCGAIPENLLESELFGYMKGAFTGAAKEGKLGLVYQANKGTLFLDEIGDLPLALQVKVLQLIQEKIFYPVGGIKPIEVDIRIIAATNKNLLKMVEKGQFREDLYYRLNVVPINVPPLRERTEEIPILVKHFLKKFEEKYHETKYFTSHALERFIQYSWPGNVRQLENLIERLVVTTEEKTIDIKHLPVELQQMDISDRIIQLNKIVPLESAIEKLEKDLLLMAFRKYSSTHKVAKALGVHRSTIIRKVNKYFGNETNF